MNDKMTKYEGEIVSISGWETTYKYRKDDGTLTDRCTYQSFAKIGEDRYVVSPYWHGEDHAVVMTAAEVLDLISVK